MTRCFCDKCGKEVTRQDTARIRRKLGRFEVEVLTAVDGVWNGGHLCRQCVVKIVTTGKARPQ